MPGERRALATATPEKSHFVCAGVISEDTLFYAVEERLFCYDLSANSFLSDLPQPHTQAVRVVCENSVGSAQSQDFSADPRDEDARAKKRRIETTADSGRTTSVRYATAGDDKTIVLWSHDRKELGRYQHQKKITCATFDPSGRKLLFADKFGDVYELAVEGVLEHGKKLEAKLLFGHLAIVTSMCFLEKKQVQKTGVGIAAGTAAAISPASTATSASGAGDPQAKSVEMLPRKAYYLVTGDNHEKIRVSNYPQHWDIETFCLGHTGHITKLLAIPAVTLQSKPRSEVLVSLGADGKLCLWDVDQPEGRQLVHCSRVLDERGLPDAVPTEVCFLPDGYVKPKLLVHVNSQFVAAAASGSAEPAEQSTVVPSETKSTLGAVAEGKRSTDLALSGDQVSVPHALLHRSKVPVDHCLLGCRSGRVFYVNQKTGHLFASSGTQVKLQDLGPENLEICAKKERLYKYFKDDENAED
ncbi:unnamed protein product [Amoebophrya sp. A120]|nr:unnamed protein product [Amoebophrya sp. A120]|eukprot:GSA120T00002210001.1